MNCLSHKITSKTMAFKEHGCFLIFLFLVLPSLCNVKMAKKKKLYDGKEVTTPQGNFQERNTTVVDNVKKRTGRLGMSSRLTDLRRSILQRLNSNAKFSVAFPILILSLIFLLITEMALGTLLVAEGAVG